MKLFNESENKYYELLSYLVNGKGAYSDKEIIDYLDKSLGDSRDFDIEDLLFDHNPDNATILTYEDGEYFPVLADSLPIRPNRMDLQAVKSLINMPFSSMFLAEETQNKLKAVESEISLEWSVLDITVKNQFQNNEYAEPSIFFNVLKTILRAIQEHKCIHYDNILPGRYDYRDEIVYPVKVEYSFINDMFRICAYNEDEDRFIKMNLSTMKNVRLGKNKMDSLDAEYKEYLDINTKKVVLDVEPVGHVIERCFRIFSYYDRLARYDKENDKYTLEIKYLKADEAEVIRDILSLGGYVVVTEPRRIQKEVYKRIMQANENYK